MPRDRQTQPRRALPADRGSEPLPLQAGRGFRRDTVSGSPRQTTPLSTPYTCAASRIPSSHACPPSTQAVIFRTAYVIVQLRRDPRLGFLRVLGPLGIGLLALYALYLATTHDWTAALLAVVLGLLASVQALRTRRAEHAGQQGIWTALLNVASVLLALYASGEAAMPWLFPVLMTNYFLCEPRRATLVSLPLLLVMIFAADLNNGLGERFSAVSVTALTMCAGYALSLRMNDDRVHLEELASLDALTGLPNRRMLERTLTRSLEERRGGHRFNGLIILDVDHFKEINDLYGHAAGDTALADLATILRFEIRGENQVFRFGGEEFVVLLRADSIEELDAATERLRRTVRGSLRGPGGRITVSLGAAMHSGETHWQDWFSRADAALYIAKNNGRDSYRVADTVL